jgi:hypothetical protein
MIDAASVLVLAAIAIGAWWWLRRSGGTSHDAEAQLRRICFGNDEQVERLIDGEMTRAPGISRAEAAGRAVLRYRRDNR